MGRKRRKAAPQAREGSSPATTPAPVSGFPWTWGLALAVVAFAVRAAVSSQLQESPLYQRPQLDSFEFLVWAQSIARGELFRWLAPSHGPGYPYFLAFLLTLLGGSLPAVYLVQALMGAGLCVVAAALAARIFEDRRAGLAAGLLLAFYGPLIYLEISLFVEGLFTLLLILALWLLVRARPSTAAALGIGALIGAAAISRATALPLMPALAALILLRPSRWPRKSVIWMAAAWLAFVAPVIVLLRYASGGWLPVQAYGGLNFYMGNRPGASGTPEARLGGSWDLLYHEPTRQGITIDAERESYFMRKAWREIGEKPLSSLAGLGRKAVWLLQAEEVRDNFLFFRERSSLLGLLPGFGLLLPLAAWGLWVARRRLPAEVILYLALFAASNVMIVVSNRYRIPLVPALAAVAGGAVIWLIDRARERRWRELAPAMAVLVAAVLVSRVWQHEPSRNFSEEWSMTAGSLQILERPAEAREAVDRALEADPESPLAWLQDGRLRLARQDFAGAEASFAKAARFGPGYQRARFNLGVALKRRGDLDGAVRELREALRIIPGDRETLAELGDALLAKGEVDEARRMFRQLVEKDPGNSAAWLALARIEGAARNPKAGVEMAAKAAEADPSRAETWMVLSMLALDARDAATAETALTRAQTLMPDAPAVGLGWALLERLKGDPAEADRRLRDLLRRYPGFPQAVQLFLANAAEMGRREEAEAFLRGLGTSP